MALSGPPSQRPVYLRAEADGQPKAGGLAGEAKLLRVQSMYTTAAEMLATEVVRRGCGEANEDKTSIDASCGRRVVCRARGAVLLLGRVVCVCVVTYLEFCP